MSQARIVRYTRDGEPTADMHREKAKEYLDFFHCVLKLSESEVVQAPRALGRRCEMPIRIILPLS
jgi:hypothetical protein